MINMVEHSDVNRDMLFEAQTLGHYEGEFSQTQILATSALVQVSVDILKKLLTLKSIIEVKWESTEWWFQ